MHLEIKITLRRVKLITRNEIYYKEWNSSPRMEIDSKKVKSTRKSSWIFAKRVKIIFRVWKSLQKSKIHLDGKIIPKNEVYLKELK